MPAHMADAIGTNRMGSLATLNDYARAFSLAASVDELKADTAECCCISTPATLACVPASPGTTAEAPL